MFRSGQTTTFRQPLGSAPKALLVPLLAGGPRQRAAQSAKNGATSVHPQRAGPWQAPGTAGPDGGGVLHHAWGAGRRGDSKLIGRRASSWAHPPRRCGHVRPAGSRTSRRAIAGVGRGACGHIAGWEAAADEVDWQARLPHCPRVCKRSGLVSAACAIPLVCPHALCPAYASTARSAAIAATRTHALRFLRGCAQVDVTFLCGCGCAPAIRWHGAAWGWTQWPPDCMPWTCRTHLRPCRPSAAPCASAASGLLCRSYSSIVLLSMPALLLAELAIFSMGAAWRCVPSPGMLLSP